jgi:hypothetical protein
MLRSHVVRIAVVGSLLALVAPAGAQNQDGVSVGQYIPTPAVPSQVADVAVGQALNGLQVGPVTPLPQAASSANIIDFDDASAPCNFSLTTAVREQYATRGVHFDGPAALDGGAILDECGSFGVSGHSSPNFIAFNTGATLMDGGKPRGPQTIRFDFPLSSVRILAGHASAGVITRFAPRQHD